MKKTKINALTQNLIIGTVTGLMVAINLRFFFMRLGEIEYIWIIFIFLGPIIGFLSGKERLRMEKLRREKMVLTSNLEKIQKELERSTKKYNLIVENANDAIFITSTDGKFLLFNQATCLLSGYKRNELRTMKLIDLQDKNIPKELYEKVWLDNNISRYETYWKTKNGNTICLEINSKWIEMDNYELILHIGRDMTRTKDEEIIEKAMKIQKFQKKEIKETASLNSTIFKYFMKYINGFEQLVNMVQNSNSKIDDKFTQSLSDLKRISSIIKMLSDKNSRDMENSVSRWDINEILHQEIQYLDITSGSKSFTKRISLAPHLPQVNAIGSHISAVLQIIFKAAYESILETEVKEIAISTKKIDKDVMIEIFLPQVFSFDRYLNEVVDPYFDKREVFAESEKNLGFVVCQNLLNAFGANINSPDKRENGTIVRMRIPIATGSDHFKTENISQSSEDSVII